MFMARNVPVPPGYGDTGEIIGVGLVKMAELVTVPVMRFFSV